MRVLIAPDKFKDALTAEQAAAAMKHGLTAARHNARPTLCPLADGGEGSAFILARALGATAKALHVTDPLGRTRVAFWWRSSDGNLAIIELAAAAGLQLLQPSLRNPVRSTTRGVGELIRAAADSGCREILLCVGGSATVDGGAGALQALGWKFLSNTGTEINQRACAGVLPCIDRIQPPDRPLPASITLLCDVENPLLGPRGAAPSFAPQKGATPDQIAQLESALAHWADLLQQATARDVRSIRYGGAAGGIAAAFAATFRATLVSGFDYIAQSVGLALLLRRCDLCLTGEGRLDENSASGKVLAGVARYASAAQKPVTAFVGSISSPDALAAALALGFRDIVPVTPPDLTLQQALPRTADLLRDAVFRCFSS